MEPRPGWPGTGALSTVTGRTGSLTRGSVPRIWMLTAELLIDDAPATRARVVGVIAEFGARSASWNRKPTVPVVPVMAEEPITNEVSGCVAVVQRGSVPLVVKARRAQAAGCVGCIILNTDDRPLLAHGHRFDDGSEDSGHDIYIPVSAAPSSVVGENRAVICLSFSSTFFRLPPSISRCACFGAVSCLASQRSAKLDQHLHDYCPL